MLLAVGDTGKAGQVAFVVQKQVNLRRPFGALVLGPVKQTGAQIDASGVQAQQLVLEAELLLASGHAVALRQQILKHRLVQLPRPVFIGIGQRGPVGRAGNPQVPQLALTGRQAIANLAQGPGPAELAKQHGHKLAPAGETAGMPFGFVLLDSLLELDAWKQLEQLRENAAYSIHGGNLRSVGFGSG
jgi:hypothetical protein